ncbi:MAG: aminoacyl-tRNA hydrolase, partial [Polaromonas sp.]|nr:aminoacyl-tRNA hydrolase [Polaromonas sp.]
LLAGEMDKATMMIHTSAPPRPKPPRKMQVDDSAAMPVMPVMRPSTPE